MSHGLPPLRDRGNDIRLLARHFASSEWKIELGMGACQLRSGQGQTRHMHLVMLAYTFLMRQLRNRRANDWTREKLTTIGQACRAVTRETLRWAITEIVDKSQQPAHVIAQLGLI